MSKIQSWKKVTVISVACVLIVAIAFSTVYLGLMLLTNHDIGDRNIHFFLKPQQVINREKAELKKVTLRYEALNHDITVLKSKDKVNYCGLDATVYYVVYYNKLMWAYFLIENESQEQYEAAEKTVESYLKREYEMYEEDGVRCGKINDPLLNLKDCFITDIIEPIDNDNNSLGRNFEQLTSVNRHGRVTYGSEHFPTHVLFRNMILEQEDIEMNNPFVVMYFLPGVELLMQDMIDKL